jgi:hypothetical protein
MDTDSTGSTTHLLDRVPFSATVDDVLQAMKVRKVPPSLTRLAEELLARSLEVARPRALARESYVDSRTDDGVTIDGHVFTSHVLRRNLDGVQRVFPFVATCGVELDAVQVGPSDLMASYCMDTIRMLALQTARREMERHLKSVYATGQLSRMAPGSLEDWPLQEQKPLFALLGDVESRIGVKLTDRMLMLPIKSISGIYFPTEVRFESCQLCQRPNCPGRRTPYDAAAAVKFGV